MGKKKNNAGGGDNKNTGSNGGAGGGDKKKDDSILTVVLKLDMHCEGCATKIKKSVRSFEGVKVVKGGEGELTKLTVIGKVDPAKLREAVEKKAKKKVELISPIPPKKENKNEDGNKENKNGNEKNGGGGEKEKKGGGETEKKGGGGGGETKSGGGEKKGEDNKKAKELPVSTAVMKLNLHCHGCIQKIRKIVSKTKGYIEISIDEEKNQITVKGTMDMKSLSHTLSNKLRKTIEIVPPKQEKEKEKEKPKEKENTGGGSKGKCGGGGSVDAGGGESKRLVEYVQCGYPNLAVFEYGYGYGYPIEQSRGSNMFSDENPNACSVM